MAEQLDVTSTAPTLLFDDTAGGGKDYRFRLEADTFTLDREKTGGGWDEVMAYDIADGEWRIRGQLVLEDSASVGPEVQLDYSGTEMWKVQSKEESLEFKRITAGGPRGPLDLMAGGNLGLTTYGGNLSDIRRDGTFVFDEMGGAATIIDFRAAGVAKASISPSGKGIFAGISPGQLGRAHGYRGAGRHLVGDEGRHRRRQGRHLGVRADRRDQ